MQRIRYARVAAGVQEVSSELAKDEAARVAAQAAGSMVRLGRENTRLGRALFGASRLCIDASRWIFGTLHQLLLMVDAGAISGVKAQPGANHFSPRRSGGF